MRQKFVKVPVEGFTAKEVLTLWRKGELYRKDNAKEISDEELLARCQQETLAYVSTINDYATTEWRPYINKVWEAIVSKEPFASGLVMRQKRCVNRYFITSIVFNLQARGVYCSCEQVSSLKLHLTLEGVTKKNSIYKNFAQYPITIAQRKHLSLLIEDFWTSLK